MASLTSGRVRLSPWLKLLALNKEGLLQISRASASTSLSGNAFHCAGHQPTTFSSSLKASPQTVRLCQPCLHLQRQGYTSGVPLDVPQVDLEWETKSRPSSAEKVGGTGRSASDILQSLSPEEARKLKIIKLEFDIAEQMNGKVPEVMGDENWVQALQLDSKSKRLRYYAFLRRTEDLKKAKKRKQQVRQQLTEPAPRDKEEAREKNTIFFTIRETTFKRAGNYRLAHAMQFGQPLVFDMDYEQYMRHQDCQNLVFQLLLSYSKNREARDPFHLVFSSLNPGGRVLRMLRGANLTGAHFMGTMTHSSYLDLFPRERLVYLSPHASHSLREVSADDVYIVGGIVDKINTQPLSLARAKEQGIRVAKFPLDNYLLWGSGSKSLTLDQVMSILLEQRRTQDWNQAFKAIPQRKLHRDDV